MKVAGLTDRQREVRDYVLGYWAENGYGPSYRDICAHFGFSGPGAVVGHIRALVRKGVIETLPHDRGVYPVGLRMRISAAAKLAAAT